MSVSKLFDGTERGVFHVSGEAGEVQRTADGAGWHVLTLDTTDVVDKDGFMDAVKDTFDLPAWFGRNWDALDECLRAIDLSDPDGLLVIWQGWADFAVGDPDGFETALEVFHDATVAWRDDEVDGAVLLVGDGPETDLANL